MLNLSVFPFARTPLLPDADPPGVLSYALPGPADRFLPFVLSRPANPNKRLDCAKVVDADTGELVLELVTTPILPIPASGLAYEKYTDLTTDTDYLVYFGAIVPRMSLALCRRYRLVVDEFTSAAFTAISDTQLQSSLLVEWFHPAPLGGLPYGGGLRQRFYIQGGVLRFSPPKEVKEVSADAITAAERIDYLALTRAVVFQLEPVPGWLAEAFFAAKAHAFFQVDGALLTALSVKETPFGEDRVSLELTALDTQVLISRSCPPPVLAVVPANGYLPRRYLCGDATDTNPDYQRTGNVRCQQDSTSTWTRTGQTRCVQV